MGRSSYVYNATGLTKARSSWTQSKSHKFSFPFGMLVPLGMPVEVLPGDTWKLDMGSIIRMLTPKAPLMDLISGDVYAYYVPNRIVYDKSKQFFGENEQEAWTLNLEHKIPHIKLDFSRAWFVANTDNSKYLLSPSISGTRKSFAGSLFDHFELPFVYLNSDQYNSLPSGQSAKDISINLLPFRGYQMIWNEDFRNPSVVDPMLDFNYDHSDITTSFPTWMASHSKAFDLKPVMRYRDLFSSSLKAPQRGPSATIFLGQNAKLMTGADEYNIVSAVNHPISFFSELVPGSPIGGEVTLTGSEGIMKTQAESNNIITKTNLLVDLSSATSATVNQLRQSIALQHLYEMMTSAFRYNEYTEVFFGVRGSDPILDRPQQLGGLHFNFNVNQVLTTANTTDGKTGDTGAFGIAQFRGHIYTNSFTEHGLIYLFVVTRKEHTYVQGLDKLWRKREFLDFYQSPLSGIGNVDIKNSEVYFRVKEDGYIDDGAFAYTEPYYEYRHMQSRACGLMNPLHPSSLSFYSLTDVFSSKPYLNEAFVSEDPSGLDNALVAPASQTDQFYGEVYLRYSCTRVMALYDVPGLTRI